MDRTAVAVLFEGGANRHARPLRGTCLAWRGVAMNVLAESLASLDEIAAWVNEGGAGGEVRR